MPDVRERVTVEVPLDEAWSFLRDIKNWAALFPGYQDIEIVDDDDSVWKVKGDVGILTKLVTFNCHVTTWAEREYVSFTLDCVEESVTGLGDVKIAGSEGQTDLQLFLSFTASGLLGPVVNALLGKVLPKMTSAFSASLKTTMEDRLRPVAAEGEGR